MKNEESSMKVHANVSVCLFFTNLCKLLFSRVVSKYRGFCVCSSVLHQMVRSDIPQAHYSRGQDPDAVFCQGARKGSGVVWLFHDMFRFDFRFACGQHICHEQLGFERLVQGHIGM